MQLMRRISRCAGFCVDRRASGRACASNTFLSRAYARTSRCCKVPFNFWLLCIVFDPSGML
jgi:hypothetical protein